MTSVNDPILNQVEAGQLLEDAAEYLLAHGKCEGAYETEDGRVCLLGALRRICGLPNSDAELKTIYGGTKRAELWINLQKLEELTTIVERANGIRGLATFSDSSSSLSVVNALGLAAAWAREGRCEW